MAIAVAAKMLLTSFFYPFRSVSIHILPSFSIQVELVSLCLIVVLHHSSYYSILHIQKP